MSKVYFLELKNQNNLKEAGKKISRVFSDFFEAGDKVAVKLHFGERNNKTYISPVLVQSIYEQLATKVKKAVLIDCTVLYKSERSLGSSHINLAKENGFDFAPILIADGEKGNEEIEIEINQKHFKKVKIGKAMENFNGLLTISHLTGHGSAAYGGALKNVGMGLGSKAGKLAMHEAFDIKVNPATCIGCGACVSECPTGAIILEDNVAKINKDKCISCGQCISVCPAGAVEIPWGSGSSESLQERIVEYTLGALKNKKSFFINVLLDVTANCDCVRRAQSPIMEDIGILASTDIVAVDKASLDLAGIGNFRKEGLDPLVQINYAQKLGLGSSNYKLEKIS